MTSHALRSPAHEIRGTGSPRLPPALRRRREWPRAAGRGRGPRWVVGEVAPPALAAPHRSVLDNGGSWVGGGRARGGAGECVRGFGGAVRAGAASERGRVLRKSTEAIRLAHQKIEP